MARWRRTFSPKGPYLDALAHYSTEAALPAALGIRADGGWESIGGWTALGLTVSVLVLLLKSETHLVAVMRVKSGLPARRAADAQAPGGARPRREAPAASRFCARFTPWRHRCSHSPRPIVDAAADDLTGSRALLLGVLVAAAVIAVVGHLLAILASDRLTGPDAGASD